MNVAVYGVLGLAIASYTCSPAFPQDRPPMKRCDTRAEIGERLSGELFSESVIITAASTSGKSVLEFWVNPETESWTVTVTNSKGMTCINAGGKGYEVDEDNASKNIEEPA